MMSETVYLFTANVMVSMGSSGSYIIPAVKSHKKLLHFYFPPKECNIGSTPVSDSDISNHWAYRAYFMRRGVLPMNPYTGEVLTSY